MNEISNCMFPTNQLGTSIKNDICMYRKKYNDIT